MSSARVLSLAVGRSREFDYHGRPAQSAIWKSPVSGRVAVRGVNFDGDDQADRQAHGGPDKAVYAYAIEDARWWEAQLGRVLETAQFGQNLTTEGVDVNGALVGERWAIGTAVLEVSCPRIPCRTFQAFWDVPQLVRRFTDHGAPGAYLRIVQEGEVGAGDRVTVVHRPAHGVTIGETFRGLTGDRSLAPRLLEAVELPERDLERVRTWVARSAAAGTAPA